MSETAAPTHAPRPAAPVRRRLLLVVLVLALLAAAATAGLLWWRGRGTELDRAVSLVPPTTERLSWVDWAAVRAELGADLGPDPAAGEVEQLLGEAFEADLSSTSALVESGPTLQREVGISPGSVAWEAFSQSQDGALITVGTGELDLDTVTAALETAGWRPPPDDDGVWVGGADLVAGIDPTLTPLVSFVAVLADEGLVLASDDSSYLERAVDAAQGEAEAGVASLATAAEALAVDGEAPLSASLLTGTNACAALAMAQADDAAQAEADALLEAAGEVHPYTAVGTALLPTDSEGAGGGGGKGDDGGDGDRPAGRVVMVFETDDQARTDADSRARLAVGPAPGQGGAFTDRFELEEARAEGATVVLEVTPLEGTYFVSDLSNGPVLYATC